MNSLLWKRELNGAMRSLIRRPWMVPLVLGVWVIIVQVAGIEFPPEGPPRFISYWPPGALIGIWGPQLMLILAMVGMVAWRVVEGRRDPGLALCLISPREIALAKTFAPTIPTLLVIACIAILESVLGTRALDEMILWRLSLYRWYDAVIASQGFEISSTLAQCLRAMLVLRAVLFGVVAVTLTTWLGARLRSAWWTMIGALVILALISGLVLLGEGLVRSTLLGLPQVQASFMHLIVAFSTVIHPDQMYPKVIGEAVMMTVTRILLPLAWLNCWWFWTSRGFARRYFIED